MIINSDRLNDLLYLCLIRRWNIIPLPRPGTVAEHSYRVAVFTRELLDRLEARNPYLRAQALEWALDHDGPEAATGDIAGPVKEALSKGQINGLGAELCPWYAPPPAAVIALVKLADLIDAFNQCRSCAYGPTRDWALRDIRKQLDEAIGVMEQIRQSGTQQMVNDILQIAHNLESPWVRRQRGEDEWRQKGTPPARQE